MLLLLHVRTPICNYLTLNKIRLSSNISRLNAANTRAKCQMNQLSVSQSRLSIRRATVADATMLSKFGAELFEATFRGTCPDSDMALQLQQYYNEDQVRSELENVNDFFHLMSLDDQVCGYSRLKESVPPQAVSAGLRAIELKRLYFSAHVHGLGLAAQLLRFNLNLAKQMGYQRVYLSVWEFNHRAKAFYQKMGFTDTGVENPFPIGDTPQMDFWYALNL